MKKIITLLLAVVMLAAVFASCTNEPEETTPTPNVNPETPAPGGASTPSESDPTLPPEDTDDKLNLDLDALDYDGDTVYIYGWTTGRPEFTVDEDAVEGDPVSEGIYKRNLHVEEGLGIVLDFYCNGGTAGGEQAWVDALKLRVEDPETPVDIVTAYSRTAPYALINGFAADLATYSEDLDLSKVWWPSLIKDEHEIKGRLFYVSGDISPGLLFMMEVLFMNKSMFKSLGNDYDEFMKDIVEDPKKSKWTLDKMIELCTPAYDDNDGVAGKSKGDTFGFIGDQLYAGDGLWATTGYKIFIQSSDEDKVYAISDELAGEQASAFIQKVQDWNATDSCYIAPSADKVWTIDTYNEHFGSAKTLFLATRFNYLRAESIDIDFAVLPYPKYTADQDRFYTCMGNPYSLYSVSPTSVNLDRSAQVIQLLAYEGYKNTTPAIFETLFKGQYAKDDYSIASCNVIRDAITFDVGRTFDVITTTNIPNLITMSIATGESWVFSAAVKRSFENKMKNTNKKIIAILDQM